MLMLGFLEGGIFKGMQGQLNRFIKSGLPLLP